MKCDVVSVSVPHLQCLVLVLVLVHRFREEELTSSPDQSVESPHYGHDHKCDENGQDVQQQVEYVMNCKIKRVFQ